MERELRLKLATNALKGISIGDAFGDSFFGDREVVLNHISSRTVPETKWEFTDDTVMAIAIYRQLQEYGAIRQDELASLFSNLHDIDPYRGYGATARKLLRDIGEGGDWKLLSSAVFDGMGSMGNGASMRVGSIGAYYYDDVEKVKELATQSAVITHSNLEAITGAIAVAVATAYATQIGKNEISVSPRAFLEMIVKELPDTDTRSRIKRAVDIPLSYHIETIKSMLGNGEQILAKDTVPFALWCAAYHLNNYEEALWKAVSILGDRDTIGAIVGGIVVMSSSNETVPKPWINSVERFEDSRFLTTN